MKRIAAVVLLAGASLALSASSCAEQPVNVPVRTFDRPEKVDFVCMQVLAPDEANPGFLKDIEPRPVPQSECPPVAAGVDGASLLFHLFAVVTQTTRGELAVVDLTAGGVVDVNHATPGINFLPVGAQPTDVAVSPDGVMTFVAAAEPNKNAIYAIPASRVLGDSRAVPGQVPPELTAWPVCALPQRPGAMAIVPRGTTAADGGADASASTVTGYEVVVVLPGNGGKSSKVITLDPIPFIRGAGITPAGLPPGPSVPPASLVDCPVTSAIELSGNAPSTWAPGPPWETGIPYGFPPAPTGDGGAPEADAGADASTDAATAAGDAATSSSTSSGESVPPVPGCSSTSGDAGSNPLPPGEDDGPQGGFAAFDGRVLYVADAQLPLIHAIDLSVPGSPKELAPFLATSEVNPQRRVEIGQIAVSPTTRDYKRYLYAIDRREGSLMVFDVTDPDTAPRSPLTRPNPEINPFQAPDRIALGGPVVAVSFARHDFTPHAADGTKPVSGARGILCNPNPQASNDPQAPGYDPGTLFRADAPNQDPQLALGPFRLRGIFGFATLAGGQVVAIDVDDWDSPCRRPVDMTQAVSSVTPPQPGPTSTTDIDPFHAPVATGTTSELFFPMTAPNRARSRFLVRVDPDVGTVHVPGLTSRPQLELSGTSLPTTGIDGERNPFLVPATTAFPDLGSTSQVPGVRISWEDPQVHIDQDWFITYEGVLPTIAKVVGSLASTDNYSSITLSQSSAFFCRSGIEDLRVGRERARAQLAEMARAGLTPPALPLDQRVVDYVQVTDEILGPDDPYWRADNDCWDVHPPQNDPGAVEREAARRQEVCSATYGAFAGEVTPNVFRDFPVLEASDSTLVLGRFGYVLKDQADTATTSNRVAVSADPSNASFMKQLKCCFHNQVHYNVRTGGQWLTVGSTTGVLHHIQRDESTGACVQSCQSRDTLLNSRAPLMPAVRNRDPALAPDRNSVLAMRNPMFSFAIYSGLQDGVMVLPARDTQWRFATRGGFNALAVSIATQTVSVSPQSMRFVDAFQQLAVVDGSAQGLVLIDLNTLAFAHAPYF